MEVADARAELRREFDRFGESFEADSGVMEERAAAIRRDQSDGGSRGCVGFSDPLEIYTSTGKCGTGALTQSIAANPADQARIDAENPKRGGGVRAVTAQLLRNLVDPASASPNDIRYRMNDGVNDDVAGNDYAGCGAGHL